VKQINDTEEFKQIIKIIPTDGLAAIKICDATEKFMFENPEESQKIIEEEFRKITGTKSFREFMEAFEG